MGNNWGTTYRETMQSSECYHGEHLDCVNGPRRTWDWCTCTCHHDE